MLEYIQKSLKQGEFELFVQKLSQVLTFYPNEGNHNWVN